MNLAGTVFKAVKAAALAVAGAIKTLWERTENLRILVVEVAKVVGKALVGAFRAVVKWVGDFVDGLKILIEDSTLVQIAIDTIVGTFKDLWEAIKFAIQFYDQLIGRLDIVRKSKAEKFQRKFNESVEATAEAVKKAYEETEEFQRQLDAVVPPGRNAKKIVEDIDSAFALLSQDIAGINNQLSIMEDFGVSANVAAQAVQLLLDPKTRKNYTLEQIVELARAAEEAARKIQDLVDKRELLDKIPKTLDLLPVNPQLDPLPELDLSEFGKDAQAARQEAERLRKEAEEKAEAWFDIVDSARLFSDILGDLDSSLGDLIHSVLDVVEAWKQVNSEAAKAGGFEGAFAGAQFGSSISGFFGGERDYGAEGAELGGFIGGLFGVGSWGAIIGGALGSLIDKGVEEAGAHLRVHAGKVDTSTVWGELSGAMQEYVDALALGMQELASATVSNLVEGFELDLEIEDAGDGRFEVDFHVGPDTLPGDASQTIFEQANRIFDNLADATAFAMAEAIRQGAFEGLSPEAERLLGAWAIDTQKEFDEALALALRLERRRLGDAAFEMKQTFGGLFDDFEAGLAAGLDPGSLMQGVVNGINDLRDSITGAEKDQRKAAEERAAIFNAELGILRARIELQLIELENEQKKLALREEMGGIGTVGITPFHADPTAGSGGMLDLLFPLTGDPSGGVFGVPQSGLPIGNGLGVDLLNKIKNAFNNIKDVFVGGSDQLANAAGLSLASMVPAAGSMAAAGEAVGAAATSAGQSLQGAAGALAGGAGAVAVGAGGLATSSNVAAHVMAGSANQIIGVANQAAAATQTAGQRLVGSLRELLDLLPDPIAPGEIRIPSAGRVGGGGSGGADQRRRTREDFRAELARLEAQMAGTAASVLDYRDALAALDDKLEEARKAGISAGEIARMLELSSQALRDEFLRPFQEIVALADQSPFDGLLDRYKEAIELDREMRGGSGGGDIFQGGVGDVLFGGMASTMSGVSQEIGQAFGIEILEAFQAQVASLVGSGDAAGIRELLTSFMATDVPPELRAFFEEVLPDAGAAVRQALGEIQQGLVDSLGLPLQQQRKGLTEFADTVTSLRALQASRGVDGLAKAVSSLEVEAELAAEATGSILGQLQAVLSAAGLGEGELSAEIELRMREAAFHLEVARLNMMVEAYRELGLLSEEVLGYIDETLQLIQDNPPDFDTVGGNVTFGGGVTFDPQQYQDNIEGLINAIEGTIDAWLRIGQGPLLSQAMQMNSDLERARDQIDQLLEMENSPRTRELAQQLEDAFIEMSGNWADEVLAEMSSTNDGLVGEFEALLAHFDDVRAAFEELGIMSEHAEAFAAAQQAALEQFWDQATAGVQSIIDRLTGVESGRAAEDLLGEQQAVVEDLFARILEGDLSALEDFDAEAEDLLDLIDEVFGSGRAGGILRDQLLAMLQQVAGLDPGEVLDIDLGGAGVVDGGPLGGIVDPYELRGSDLIAEPFDIASYLTGRNGRDEGFRKALKEHRRELGRAEEERERARMEWELRKFGLEREQRDDLFTTTDRISTPLVVGNDRGRGIYRPGGAVN